MNTFDPEPGDIARHQQQTGTTTPAAADAGGWLDTVTGALSAIPTNRILMAAVAAALVALVAAKTLANRRKRSSGTDRPGDLTSTDRAITRITAAIATAVLAVGMWKFFGEVLHVHWTIRVGLFAFVEVQILAVTRRARRHLHRHGTLGNAALTIYFLAAVTGGLAAIHAASLDERLFRLFAAAVAARMWVDELREERDILLHNNPDQYPDARRKKPSRINWSLTPERVLVFLRLAEPADRTVGQVDAQRRVDQLARLLNRYHELNTSDVGRIKKFKVAFLNRRITRLTQAANRHINLAQDPVMRQMLFDHLDAVRGIKPATAPDARRDATLWTRECGTPKTIDGVTVTGDTDTRQVTAGETPELTASPDRQVTAPTDAVTDVTAQSPSPATDAVTDAGDVTPASPVTSTVTDGPVTRASNARPVTRHRRATITVTGVTSPDAARALSRELVEQARDGMTDDQVEQYAADRARQTAAETGNKTAGMREYFLTCVALGVEPIGTFMARAVGVSEGLGRGKAKEWRGELAVDDAELVLTDALRRIAAERQASGDGND